MNSLFVNACSLDSNNEILFFFWSDEWHAQCNEDTETVCESNKTILNNFYCHFVVIAHCHTRLLPLNSCSGDNVVQKIIFEFVEKPKIIFIASKF